MVNSYETRYLAQLHRLTAPCFVPSQDDVMITRWLPFHPTLPSHSLRTSHRTPFVRPPQDYVMMTRWLPSEEPCTLPPNASHQVC